MAPMQAEKIENPHVSSSSEEEESSSSSGEEFESSGEESSSDNDGEMLSKAKAHSEICCSVAAKKPESDSEVSDFHSDDDDHEASQHWDKEKARDFYYCKEG
ncbi:unnamed protein product [Microthlaspi erraticum]|uniref:Uncharacterized protein n=1 Tax=Microthlaspi erraticum TaxID=1685480 RepID=A0A6D2IFB5_9BRAS|nr:unnamed protein product [Microthlaspi erraticum]